MTNEEYVRSKWEEIDNSQAPDSIWIRRDWATFSADGWSAAAEFTRQREEEIRQVEEEIGVCEGCLRMWQPPFGNDYGGVGPMKRILSREQAVLDKLKRGMK